MIAEVRNISSVPKKKMHHVDLLSEPTTVMNPQSRTAVTEIASLGTRDYLKT